MSLLEKAMEKYQCVETTESAVESVDNWSKRLRESPDELRRAAGDDWEEMSADIIGFADALAVYQIRESGSVPNSYTSTTECKNCGTVPIWQYCPSQVDGCPWCFNRHKGLPMPKGNNEPRP